GFDAVLANDAEVAKKMLVMGMDGNECAAPLMPYEYVFEDQLIDRLAQGAYGYAKTLGEHFLGGDRLPLIPFSGRKRAEYGPLYLLIQRGARRTEVRNRCTHGYS